MSALFYGLSSTFTALSNLYIADKAREQQAWIYNQNREDAQQRFLQDLELRKNQFAFTKQQAEDAFLIRALERDHQDKRDQLHRSFTQLQSVINGSPESFWLHDPYISANPGIKSFRVLFQKPKGLTDSAQSKLEHEISQAISRYCGRGVSYPVHFPTGIWKDNGPVGSWFASELHAWDQSIPTLILRVCNAGDKDCWIKADLFGFELGNRDFEQDIYFGKMPSDINDLANTLPALVLAAADIYFLHTYGKMPLLPAMLADYFILSEELSVPVIKEIVDSYTISIAHLAITDPQLGIHVALNLAEAFTEFPDKAYALMQVKRIEEMTKPLWPKYTELALRIKALYLKMGNNDQAEHIARLMMEQTKNEIKNQPNILRDHL